MISTVGSFPAVACADAQRARMLAPAAVRCSLDVDSPLRSCHALEIWWETSSCESAEIRSAPVQHCLLLLGTLQTPSKTYPAYVMHCSACDRPSCCVGVPSCCSDRLTSSWEESPPLSPRQQQRPSSV